MLIRFIFQLVIIKDQRRKHVLQNEKSINQSDASNAKAIKL